MWEREGGDRAKNDGEVKELFKLRMLLAQEQMDMASKKPLVRNSKHPGSSRKASQRGNYGGKIINRF